ncbi:hypothetical protein LEP1GSC097_0003, partial [Leptospira interrogans serovar Grippotyphosa str. UI 08368]
MSFLRLQNKKKLSEYAFFFIPPSTMIESLLIDFLKS